MKTFTLFRYLTLLNKNLDSVPTTKKYKKKQLYTDAENFFCLIKHWVHFQDIDPKPNTDQQNLLFQIKNKQKWTLKHTHHNLRSFIDLFKNDIKTKKKERKKWKTPNPVYSKVNETIESSTKREDIITSFYSNNGCRKIHHWTQLATSDKRNYKKLQESPTWQYSTLFNDTLNRLKNENLLS